MTKKAHKALLESIEHWHENLDMLILNHLSNSMLFEDIRMDRYVCSLCCVFFENACVRCPVYKHTGLPSCRGTPYRKADEILDCDSTYRSYDGLYKSMYKAISEEIDFLHSLLYKDGF